MTPIQRIVRLLAALLLLAATAWPAAAQGFPSKPLRLVVKLKEVSLGVVVAVAVVMMLVDLRQSLRRDD